MRPPNLSIMYNKPSVMSLFTPNPYFTQGSEIGTQIGLTFESLFHTQGNEIRLKFVTGFDKTRLTRTKTENDPFYSLTLLLALSRHTIDGAIDSQVCFHRRSFADPVKPRWSTTGSITMGPLMGTNKAAWGVKLLLTTVSSYQVDWQFLCPTEDIALLFGSLWMVLPTFALTPYILHP